MPTYTIQTSDGRTVRMPWSGPGVPTQADVDAFVARAPRGGQRVNAQAAPTTADILRDARPGGRPTRPRPSAPPPSPAPRPQPAPMPRRSQPGDLADLINSTGRNQHTGPGPSEPGWLARQRRESERRASEAAARGDVDQFVSETFGPRVGTPEYERLVEARRADLEQGFRDGRARFPTVTHPASAGWRLDPSTGAYVREDRDVGGEADMLRIAGVDPDAARQRSSTGTRDLPMGGGRAALRGADMVAEGAGRAARGVYGAAGQAVDLVQGGGVAAGMEADIARILGPRPAGGAAAAEWDAKAQDFRAQNWFDFGQGAVSIPLAGAAALPGMAAGALAGRGSAAMRLAQGARGALDVDQFAQGVGAGALELVNPSATGDERLQAVIATALTAGPEAAAALLNRGSLSGAADRAARALEMRGLRPEADAVRRSAGTADAPYRLEDAAETARRHDDRFGADAADEAGGAALDRAVGRYADVLRRANPGLDEATVRAQAEASARLEFERGRARLWRGGGTFQRDAALASGERPRFTSSADWSDYASGRTEFGGENADGLRGSFDPADDVARVNAGGDVSTLAHEAFHRFRRYLTPEDAAHLARWASDGRGTRWDRLTGDALVAAEERAAEGWERYLATGRAPNPRVKSAFERMRGWLNELYGGRPPGEALPDDVESVFAAQLSPGREPDYGRDQVGTGVRRYILSAMPEWVVDEANPDELDRMMRELNGPAQAAAGAGQAARRGLITEAEASAAESLFHRRMNRLLDEWWTSRGGRSDEPTLRDVAGEPEGQPVPTVLGPERPDGLLSGENQVQTAAGEVPKTVGTGVVDQAGDAPVPGVLNQGPAGPLRGQAPADLPPADVPYWERGWALGIETPGRSRWSKLHNAGAAARRAYDTGVPEGAPAAEHSAWMRGWESGRTTGGTSARARRQNEGAAARAASDAALEPYVGRIDMDAPGGANGREVGGGADGQAAAREATGIADPWVPFRFGREMTPDERDGWIREYARQAARRSKGASPERVAARVLQIESMIEQALGVPVVYRAWSDRSSSTYMVAGDRKIRFSDHELPDVRDGVSMEHGYRSADVELPVAWLDPSRPGFTPERLAAALSQSKPSAAAAEVRDRTGGILLQGPRPGAAPDAPPADRLTAGMATAREVFGENPRMGRQEFDRLIAARAPGLTPGQRRVLHAYASRWSANRETYSPDAPTFEALAARRHRGEVQGVRMPLRDRVVRVMFNDQRAAGWARKLYEDATGLKYEGTDRDLEAALNRLAVPDQRVIEIIDDGFRDADGNLEVPGVAAVERNLRAAGLDPAVVEEAFRARREIALAGRTGPGGPGISPERAAEQMARLDLWESKLTPEQSAAYRQAREDLHEWNLRVLRMYEETGLRPEGWAERIDADNPDYWPLVPRSTTADAAMVELNPERLASPVPQQKRAAGGQEYESGWITLRRRAEKAIRMGQANQALLRPLEEMSGVPALEGVVEDITAEVLEAERRARAARGEPTAAEMDEAARLFDGDGEPDPVDALAAQFDGAPVEGQDAVITLYRDGKRRIFRLDPHVWDAIRRGQPTAANPVVQVLRGLSQLARTGTTGVLNPVFGLLVNPVLDVTQAVIAHGLNPLRLGRGVRAAWTEGRSGDWYADLWRRAAEAGAFSEGGSYRDTMPAELLYDPNTWNPVQRAAQSENPKVRYVADMARAKARQLSKPLRALEQMTRIAMFDQEYRRLVKRGVSEEDARRMAGRAARDLMNFQEAGAAGRFLSSTMGVPYATIPQQAVMSLWRGYKRNPAAFAARALALITVPKLLEYATYGDDPEYRRLPDYVLDGAYVWKHGGTWYAARFPLELGAVFAGIPRRFAEMRRGRKLPEEAAREQTRQAFRSVVPPSIGTGPGLVAQLSTYLESGAILDYQFGRIVDYPTQDAAGETPDPARLATQMAGTAAGTFGRNVAQVATGRTPNPLGRFTPRPGRAAYEPTGQARAWLRRTGAGWGQAKPGRVVDAETGERRDETPEEFAARVARETLAIDAAVLRAVEDQRFRRAAPADQRALLSDVVTRAKRAARRLAPEDPADLLREDARIEAETVLDDWESGPEE